MIVLLDAGHGSIGPKGKYTTAPEKMFRHKAGEFHGDGWFYEGVWNRMMCAAFEKEAFEAGITVIRIFHDWQDWNLRARTDLINHYHRAGKADIVVSQHANASPAHNASGFEIYTSPGNTRSDSLAEHIYQEVKSDLADQPPGIRMRPDRSDGDYDREARLWMLVKHRLPAVLIENLFFDHPEDAKLLMDEGFVERMATAQVKGILRFFNP